MKIKNVAIIAHVDHGKTTLVDQLLKKSGSFKEHEEVKDRVMDSNDIERERGITILSKTTSIIYKDYKINIMDTPGHADFGGEVERIMGMVDGVLLVVDAFEGTMPQTRFVLKKAFEANKTPIVVINKVDRPGANIKKTIDEVYDLFIELGASLEQLDFPIVYASALKGTSSYSDDLSTQVPNMDAIFETIIKNVKDPDIDLSDSFQMQINLLDYSDYMGRIGIGLIRKGTVSENEVISCARLDGTIKNFRILKLFGYKGIKRVEVKEASAGDIVAIAGLDDISVGETLGKVNKVIPLPKLHIDEPTLKMTFMPNDSPFSGRDGNLLTGRKIEERLYKEMEKDVSLKVEHGEKKDSWVVCGRGELHLSILIENMRREGFELQVSKPEVILKEIDGVIMEPYEELVLDLNQDYIGSVIEALGKRGAELVSMNHYENQSRIEILIPSRGLIGFAMQYMTLTKGYGIMNHTFKEYRKLEKNNVGERINGVLVANESGQATAYSIGNLEDRGIMFIHPQDDIYEGMIVGENNKTNDLAVNVVKAKQMTNMRSASKDNTVVLKRPKEMNLEASLDYINQDELVEITPHHIRMRKKILDTVLRKKFDSHKND